jgi:hypothetical protein
MTRRQWKSSRIAALTDALAAEGRPLAPLVVARGAEGSEIGRIECPMRESLERDYVINASSTNAIDAGMAQHATVAIPRDDALTECAPYSFVVKPRHKGWCWLPIPRECQAICSGHIQFV